MISRRHFAAISASAALAAPASAEPIPLGTLDRFWRYSAALGPFLETGVGLLEIPPALMQGDFPYPKRPFAKEAPFADHLSVVRLLGGYNDHDPAMRERDLAFRGEDGKIRYRMNLLGPRLKPYLDVGYKSFTLVMDNVPWCFPEKSGAAALGQFSPPRDPAEWRAFIREVCRETMRVVGPEIARGLRFRVGTENNGRERFNGTHEEYLRHYDATVAAVREVIPAAQVGPFNISGINGITATHNVRAYDLAESGRPIDFVAFSRYFRPGDDPEDHARICRGVWDEFGWRAPRLKNVSREIHEYGIAPWGEVAKGVVARAEPGAMGAALSCQMMFRLRAAGINRLWHWGPFDSALRDSPGKLRTLPTGTVWLYTVAEHMAGGDAWLLPSQGAPAVGTQYLAVASFLPNRSLLMISAYNRKIGEHSGETVRFQIPARLLRHKYGRVRVARLSRQTSIHDLIRNELATAGQLGDIFAANPDFTGTVREMAKDRKVENAVGDRADEHIARWRRSITLQPPSGDESVENGADGLTLRVKLSPPEVVVMELSTA